MAYRFEQTENGMDIVIDGWEVGISNSPYQTIVPTNMVSNGVSDMRNVDIISVPGEASVAFATQAMTNNLALSNVAYTVNTSTDVFTWAGGTTLPNNTAVQFTNSGGALPGGLSASTAYYIINTTPTTFQLYIPLSTVQLLVVSGGGGSGFNSNNYGGAGGAGGVTTVASHSLALGAYPVVVGNGGIASTGSGTGGTGSTSSFDSVAPLGGTGGGDSGSNNGIPSTNATGGGSSGGGGAGSLSGALAGTATGGGFAGSAGIAATRGGAGGGAGGPASGTTGGVGVSNSISGGTQTYSIGGSYTANPGPGTANTGNGANGGTTGAAAIGGSGIVIISYETGSMTATGGTIGTSGSQTIHTFTTNGTFTVTAINYVDITSAGTGTNTFSVINMAQPNFIKGVNVTNSVTYYFCQDNNGRCWILDNQYLANSGAWIYMSNLADETLLQYGAGMIPWKGYLFDFDSNLINYIPLQTGSTPNTLAYFTTYSNWVRAWSSICPYSLVTHYPLASLQSPAYLYFCNAQSILNQFSSCVGSIQELVAGTFDPSNSGTYSIAPNKQSLPAGRGDSAICLEELGSNLLIGTTSNIVYQWDEFSPTFVGEIRLAENYTHRMVTVNTTTYMFCGQRGRIYLTNGANAQLFDKIPDHLSNTVNPYYIWGDATFNKNQLYFGVQATTNAGVAIPNYGGLWAIDVDTNSKRISNQLSYGTYAGNTTALCSLLSIPNSTANLPTSDGNGLYMGWFTTVGGIDKGITTPYTGGQSYVDGDIIPIGTYLNRKTFSNVEFKLSTPLVTGESVSLNYRTNITENYTNIPLTSGGNAGDFSGYGKANFQNVQWVQIRVYLTSTTTNPSYCRLKEIRLRG